MGFDKEFVFSAISDDANGVNLTPAVAARWPAYANWYTSGIDNRERPTAEVCRAQLATHMPELVPSYDHLINRLAPHLSDAHLLPQFLSLYNAPAFVAGCSQAAWQRPEGNALIRNYDFPLKLWDAMLLHSNWNGTRVIAMTDCLWGVLDGINEHGLTASLSFGGKLQVGDGFAVTLALRYVLEFCRTVAEACAVLQRIPVAMAYNIVLMDAAGDHRTVFIGPGQTAEITQLPTTTNHQPNSGTDTALEILSDSRVRDRFLQSRVNDQHQTLEHLKQLFLSPPLYRSNKDAKGWGTIYTACYQPQLGSVSLLWPNQEMTQSFAGFQDGQIQVTPTEQRANIEDQV
ncbi:MAG: C45 family autoproteolytic acyltransferase/hydrolase [Porticoccaceae bacterium]|nr:C45 family autoproteolytic acyltransferase/hydrolase [Porticoccaceae bacterium]